MLNVVCLINTCFEPLLIYGKRTVPSLVCHWVRKYCEVGHNCLSVRQSVCLPELCPLPQHPWTLETCPTFWTCVASLPSFPFFHSSPQLAQPPGKSVSGSEMRCEWSPHQTPHNPHRYSAHTLWNIYFQCDFFSPLVPFLCLTCIRSLNQYGWLDNFTGSLTPKGTPERESLTPCSSAHSVCSPSEALI